MAKTKLVFIFLLCSLAGYPVKASLECWVTGKLLHKTTRKPYPFITLLVKQDGQILNFNPCKTDKKGNFTLDFNISDDTSMSSAFANNKRAWFYFYAVRHAGDTCLLQSFLIFLRVLKKMTKVIKPPFI